MPTITGTTGTDTLPGTSGDDLIDGLSGNDHFFLSFGNDVLNGGDGADDLSIRFGSRPTAFELPSPTGPVTLNITGSNIVGSGFGGTINTTLNSIEFVSIIGRDQNSNGSYFANTFFIDASGFEADVAPGNFALFTDIGPGAHQVTGTRYADRLSVGQGSTVDAGEGNDYVRFRLTTEDLIIVDQTGSVVTLTSGGQTIGSISNAESLAFYPITNLREHLRIDASALTVGAYFSATAQVNTIIGGSGADVFAMNLGFSGSVLTGGDGADVFADYLIAYPEGTVEITDFSTEDQIDLSGYTVLGMVAADGFIGSAAFSGTRAEIRYHFDGGNTVLEIDHSGDGIADASIVLSNGRYAIELSQTPDAYPLVFVRGAESGSSYDVAPGAPSISAGTGDDVFQLTGISSGMALTTLDGAAGTDTLDARSVSAGSAYLFFTDYSEEAGAFRVGDFIVRNVETVYGGSGPNWFLFQTALTSMTVYGGAQGDVMIGSFAHADTFYGGGGDDAINVRSGDIAFGEDGDDSFELYYSGVGTVDGGSGTDMLDLGFGWTVDLAAGWARGPATGSEYAITSVENVSVYAWQGYASHISGDAGANRFFVNSAFNDGSVGVTFDGRGGDDDLQGSAGDDQLIGGDGNDILDGGGGNDLLYGGAGDDSFIVDATGDIVFEFAGEGTDTVTSSANYYLFANIENLTLTGSADLFGVGNELANTITGNVGSNLLIGGAGNDVIRGGDGVDSLFGENGSDQLFGDAGIDYLVGGIGNDTLDGGADADALYGEDGDDVLIGGTSFHTDILVGGAGNDTLRGNSGLGDYDLMDGGAGNDSYYVDTPDDLTFEAANGGADTVYATINGAGYYLYANVENLVLGGNTPFGVGNGLDNRITGSAAANWLLGGAGNDVLNGAGGNDVLFGEAGADIFVFERGTGADAIGDFLAGTDRIDLSAFGFTSFAQVQAVMGENGGTSFIALGNGDMVVLNGVARAALSAGDFILASAQLPQDGYPDDGAGSVGVPFSDLPMGLPDAAGRLSAWLAPELHL
ncbi:calcium-binding protein [Sphingomonas sp. ST-64]|uniref:Calcium-binding protein n=1 Tax=Sphingomonas plantiphila TaxID=3163295 RepID=A0ABW8YR32_9SPHN